MCQGKNQGKNFFLSKYQSISFWSFHPESSSGSQKLSATGWVCGGDETQDMFLMADLVGVSDVE